MGALENIVAEILRQAGEQADAVINEAGEQAAAILERGRADREEWQRQFDETAEQEYREIAKQAESADRQARRQALLKERSRVIDEVIAGAKAKILDMPDKEYFDLLFRLYEKNALPLDGVIRFAPADFARITDGFLERCKQVFPDKTLELYGDMDSISRGFVIEYGNILQNCSIDGVFDSEGQTLRDKVHEALISDA